MNGYIRPEIQEPKIESADNATFDNSFEQANEKKVVRVSEASHVIPSLDAGVSGQSAVDQSNISGQQIILEKVEQILAQDMDNIFLSLDIAQQAVFKRRGEETSRQIAKLLNKGTVPLQKIVNLIISWLRIIPHINKFYLEQEAKIKADKIMSLHINK